MQDTQLKEDERISALYALGLLDAAASEDFDQITRLAAFCFNAPIALISLVDRDRQQFLSRVGFAPRETPRQSSICAHAIHATDVLEVHDLAADPRFKDSPLVTDAPHMRFYAGTPLVTESGHAIGALCVIDYRPRAFTPSERDQLKALGRLVIDQIALRQSVGRRDAVTGLANRHQLMADLQSLALIEPDQPRTFALVDCLPLAQAYEIAEAVGLGAIESTVKHMVQKIQAVLPPEATLYHIGVMRLGFVSDPASHIGLIDKICDALQAPIMADGVPIAMRAHAGLAHFTLRDTLPADLLRKCMTAVSSAQISARRLAYYCPEEDARQQRRYRLARDIQGAIETGQLHLEFQPRIDLATQSVCSVEALVRWAHPDLGVVTPNEFIPIVERTALMQPLTLWVVREGLMWLKQWHQAGLDIRMSVNLSARDFDNGKLVPALEQVCLDQAVDLSWIEFEVTEGEWLHADDSVKQQMLALLATGAAIAIDDFGSGYSNFAYMNDIPATALKIDKSLIKCVADNANHGILIEAILTLAHRLGYRTVAEGVETEAALALLASWGCKEVQGYFFAPSLPPRDVVEFVRSFQMPKVSA